jgi:hypothetical protein
MVSFNFPFRKAASQDEDKWDRAVSKAFDSEAPRRIPARGILCNMSIL